MLQAKVSSNTLGNGYDAGKRAAEEATAGLTDVKIVYLYGSAAYDSAKLIRGAKSVLGTVPIIGNTSFSGIMTSDGYVCGDYFVGMMAISDPTLRVGVAGLAKETDARMTGRKAAELAVGKAGGNCKPDYFYMAASPGEEEQYVKGISEIIGRSPLFGGSAADNDLTGKWRIYTDAGAVGDGVAVALFYSDKTFVNEFTGAYRETDKAGIITKVVNGRTLVEIDGMPAVDKYMEWSGCSQNAAMGGNLLVTTITAPLGVKDQLGDLVAIRHPMAGNPDGSMAVGNYLAPGTAISYMEGSVDELITSTEATLHRLKGRMKKEVGAFHLVHCGGRKVGIGDRMSEVFANFKKEVGDTPFIAEFTFGEYGFADDGRNTCGGLMLSFTGFEK